MRILRERSHVWMSDPITAPEIERLRIFQERVQDLRDSGLARSGPITLRVTFALGRAASAATPFEGYDEDHFKAYLTTLRQFTLNEDPAHFYSICNILYRRLDRDDLRPWIAHARESWKLVMKSFPFKFRVGDSDPITVKDSLDYLLYGKYVHTDPGKRQFMQSLTDGGRAALKYFVQRSLPTLFDIVAVLDSVIHIWLDAPTTPVPPAKATRAPAPTPPSGDPTDPLPSSTQGERQ